MPLSLTWSQWTLRLSGVSSLNARDFSLANTIHVMRNLGMTESPTMDEPKVSRGIYVRINRQHFFQFLELTDSDLHIVEIPPSFGTPSLKRLSPLSTSYLNLLTHYASTEIHVCPYVL